MIIFDVLYEFWSTLFSFTVIIDGSANLEKMLDNIAIIMTIVSIFGLTFAFIKIFRRLFKV